ncbi:hypothetical protein RHMOL_Rhmol09G0259600 [Rhododendron molle]|uniref:Uncharacterized protein n=1 Tax=Rhododendron molle TaxID=49168 RepID=A0ACC0MH68_RHOML|nr:hypothetical protein RHMOL_Rhmol09G0259600 [Rhododendron molle]
MIGHDPTPIYTLKLIFPKGENVLKSRKKVLKNILDYSQTQSRKSNSLTLELHDCICDMSWRFRVIQISDSFPTIQEKLAESNYLWPQQIVLECIEFQLAASNCSWPRLIARDRYKLQLATKYCGLVQLGAANCNFTRPTAIPRGQQQFHAANSNSKRPTAIRCGQVQFNAISQKPNTRGIGSDVGHPSPTLPDFLFKSGSMGGSAVVGSADRMVRLYSSFYRIAYRFGGIPSSCKSRPLSGSTILPQVIEPGSAY